MDFETAYKILIDHNTKDGFEAITHARQYMLEMGKKELEDPEAANWLIRGSHVLAPVSIIYNELNTFSHILSSVLMIMPVLYFIREGPPLSAASLNAFSVLHLSVSLKVLASDMKTYNILML